MRTNCRGTMLIALVAAMLLATASTLPAQEDDVPLVDGTTWNASDDDYYSPTFTRPRFSRPSSRVTWSTKGTDS